MNSGCIFTFYSYKGGVGRSFLLANVGTLLATWGYRVLCIDWDLEAPGLANFFSSFLPNIKKGDRDVPNIRKGLLELIEHRRSGSSPDWNDYVTEVDLRRPGRLSLMAAGGTADDYNDRVQSLRWDELYQVHKLGDFLESIRNSMKSVYDFILIDSRTGITDIGGICAVQMPDVLVLVFASNDQNLNGIFDIAERVKVAHNGLPYARSLLWMLPVASRFDSFQEVDEDKKWSNLSAERLGSLYNNWAHRDLPPISLIEQTKVPYIAKWSFGERLPVLDETVQAPSTISSFITRLAALIARRLSDSKDFVEKPDAYIEKARTEAREDGASLVGKVYDIYLSSPSEQLGFSSQLAMVLRNQYARSVFHQGENPFSARSQDSENLADAIGGATHFIAVVVHDYHGRQGEELVQALSNTANKLLIKRESPGQVILVHKEKVAPPQILDIRNHFFKFETISFADGDVDRVAREIVAKIGPEVVSGQGDVGHYV
jgi:CobQ/CobB/MinD/ParA nucleotide binding domain